MTGPSRRERRLPALLVAVAVLVATVAGVVALLLSGDAATTAIVAGLAFIGALLALSMLALARPSPHPTPEGGAGERGARAVTDDAGPADERE